jgi:multidrug efflux pump subunit AcrA (membrane-fusion protein)
MNYLSGMKKEPEKKEPIEIVRYVKAEPVKYENLLTSFKATGRVNSKSEVILSAEVTGKILPGNVDFKRGESFKKGDLLIRIFDDESELSLKSEKAEFLNLIAGMLPDFKIDFKESYEEWYNFFEKIDIEKELPELPKFSSTKEKVFLASRNILSDYYSIKSDEIRLKKHEIYAPFNGSFTEVTLEVGAIANAGTKLAEIINTVDLELEVPVEASDAKWVREGQTVKVNNEDNSAVWYGKITRISKDVDLQTQSIDVFVELKSSPGKPIYKGQYLIANFEGITLENVMRIPRNAVFNSNEVFVVKESSLSKREINIRKVNETNLYFDGLEEGTELVVEALVNANENTKVEIIR